MDLFAAQLLIEKHIHFGMTMAIQRIQIQMFFNNIKLIASLF